MSAVSKLTEKIEVANHSKKSVRTNDTASSKWRNNEEKCCVFIWKITKGLT